MRIGIDLFSLVPSEGRGAGYHRYVHGFVTALNELATEHTFYLFVNRLNADLFPANGHMVRKVIPLPPRRRVWPFRLLWQHAVLPAMVRRHRIDLMHFPMDSAAFAAGQPYVVTINDLIADVFYPQHFPRSQSRVKARYLFEAKSRSARNARAVICPSQSTAALVVQHYGVPRGNITVTPYAADREFLRNGGPRPARPDRPYVLSVVSLSPHKNITTLVDAFAQARERFALPHDLRIAGMRGTDPRPIERYLADQRRRGVPVRYLGFIEEEALRDAYAGADLFVYLSLAEGFGLPPLEAMASGVPVLASNATSLPEVCGDAAHLVHPRDDRAIAEAMGSILTSPERARQLAQAGQRRAHELSWTDTARLTVSVYEQVGIPG